MHVVVKGNGLDHIGCSLSRFEVICVDKCHCLKLAYIKLENGLHGRLSRRSACTSELPLCLIFETKTSPLSV